MKNIISNYQNIFSKQLPSEMNKYLSIYEMIRLKNIGYLCGADYAPNIYNLLCYYSTYDHSISTAKMVWNLTQDYKATIATLLHDIASPVFRHAIDFLNGDLLNQESTEKYTEKIIMNSKELKECLKIDGINIEDIIDYKNYPIADNKRPKLSADRLDSVLISGLIWSKNFDLGVVHLIYNSIIIDKNEEIEDEMVFDNLYIAKSFVEESNDLCYKLSRNEDILSMNMLAKIAKLTIHEYNLYNEDLYKLNELEMINLIESSNKQELQQLWKTFTNMDKIKRGFRSNKPNCFCITNDKPIKKRIIDPLVKNEGKISRISEIDSEIKRDMQKVLKYKDSKYPCVSIIR